VIFLLLFFTGLIIESFSDSEQPIKITGLTGIQICNLVIDDCTDKFYFATISENRTIYGSFEINDVYIEIQITDDKLCHRFDSEQYTCERWIGNESDFVNASKHEIKEPFRVPPPDSILPHDETIKENTSSQGCLIATASYDSELAPQVQMLREVRDNILLSTDSGALFMNGFNTVYYSFSPQIAQLENENPIFKETVKVFITPMITTLSIMTLADENSEFDVIFLGISTIGLIIGMYVVTPVVLVWKVRKRK